MTIQYLNHSSFLIKAKKNGNQITKIVIDPFNDDIGIKFKPTKADIVLVSNMHPDHNNVAGIKGLEQSDLKLDDLKVNGDKPFIIKTPGEFEVDGIMIKGIQSFHDNQQGQIRGPNTIYTITAEGLTICHLGDLGHKLTEEQEEKIGNVDVLMVPVGGTYTIGPETATEVISQIEPGYVIPMHFKTAKHSGTYSELKTLDDFLKELGEEPSFKEDEFTPSVSTNEQTKVVLLNPQYK